MSDSSGQGPPNPFALRPRALSDTLSDGAPDLSQSADARSGQDLLSKIVLGRFRVDAFLDGGSVGRIYRGVEVRTGRPVAIKALRRQRGPRGEVAKKRFIREARFLASIQHENVVELIDHGTTDEGDTVMVMELLEGHTLRRHLDETGPLPTARVLWIGIQLGRALARAHDMGGIHRDLKPANVFIERDAQDRDVVKVLDFGLVKPTQKTHQESLTLSGFVMGTPVYMSPEQAEGEAIDARSDIYSFGIMLFEMMTGVPPYSGDSVAAILTGHLDQPIPRLASKYPMVNCPEALEDLIRRCLDKEPDGRPDSMSTLVRELERQLGVTSLLPDFSELADWDPNVPSSDFVLDRFRVADPSLLPPPLEVTTPGSPAARLARSAELPLAAKTDLRRTWLMVAGVVFLGAAAGLLVWASQVF